MAGAADNTEISVEGILSLSLSFSEAGWYVCSGLDDENERICA